MALFTCITCQVVFENPEYQRVHYKTDWHRYNLKRKVAELPPVSAENFQERVLMQRAVDALEQEGKQSCHCDICHKIFTNQKSLDSHLRSRKHKDILEKGNRKVKQSVKEDRNESSDCSDTLPTSHDKSHDDSIENDEAEDIEENEPLDSNECLFCPHFEDDLETNLAHMSKVHGFFIPDLEYLVSIKDLMQYLGEKVGVYNVCLYCNDKGKAFYSVEAVQHHMLDKAHCKMFFEGDAALEYAEFYDYTKSYPDKDDHSPDEEVSTSEITLKIKDDLELVLPSGVTVGHRLLKNYYKQRVPTNERRKATLLSRVMSQYRAIGWRGTYDDGGKRDRDEKWAHKMRQQREMKIGVKANSLQKFFRPQVIF